MVRENLQHFHAFALSMVADLVSENVLVARFVGALVEAETSAALRLIDAPAGQHLGQFGDVFLRVAAIDSERVQLHDLARVVFVQPATVRLLLLRPRRRRHAVDSKRSATDLLLPASTLTKNCQLGIW